MRKENLIGFIWISLFSFSFPVFADNSFWQDFRPLQARVTHADGQQFYQKARYLKLETSSMKYALEAMARENLSYRFATVDSSRNISLPLPNGQMIGVELVYENLMEKPLKKAFPEIKTYRVLPSSKIVSGAIDMTPQGFHAMLQTSSGRTIFIDPLSINKENNKHIYVSYYKDDQVQTVNGKFSCGASSSKSIKDSFLAKKTAELQTSNQRQGILNYRIAIAATGEYTARQGGTVTNAMAAIITTLNRVNQVYEKDLGVHLSLVANNDAIIYTDAASDPFYALDRDKLLKQNQANLDAVIGSANYDIGHLFTVSGGGLAAIASVCNEHRKGQGISGINNPVNDSFNLDFVAHEIGHQLGATHTFNGKLGLCSGATRTSATAFEPGSGSSIMSYAGYCGADNLQSKTDAMFHIGSIKQIRTFSQTSSGGCGVLRQSYNRPPIANAGKNYIIPAKTPFELIGSAIDPESDNLVYSWQQVDAGRRSHITEDLGNNSLFRLYMPSDSTLRSFPSLKSVITHRSIHGEKLPEKERDLHFNFVAQDGKNVAQSDEMVVKVFPTSSRFSLYLPHSQYSRGDTHKILWNVAETDKAPIHCEAIDIFLSTDGGYNFPIVLAKNTPNEGATWITIESTTPLSRRGRFKIKCSDSIFYAISYRDFNIAEQGSTGRTLDDQDRPEPDSGNPDTSGGGNGNHLTSSSGGSFDWLFLCCLIFLRKRSFTFSITS